MVRLLIAAPPLRPVLHQQFRLFRLRRVIRERDAEIARRLPDARAAGLATVVRALQRPA